LRGQGHTSEAAQPVLTVEQLAHAFGVTLRSLRFYETRGFLSPRRGPRGGAFFVRPTSH